MTDRRDIVGVLLLIILVTVAGWLWFIRLRKPTDKIVETGTLMTSEPLDIRSRTIVVVPPKPGVIFSTVRKLAGNEVFAFLILVKYGNRISSRGPDIFRSGQLQSTCELEHFGKWARTSAAFTLNGKPIEVAYRVELDEACTMVAKERLMVEGNYVDTRSGRVFLVDLTAEPPVYRQVNVDLPMIPKKLETNEDAERAAEQIRKSLENRDQQIKAFCRSSWAPLQTNLGRTMILTTSSDDEIIDPNEEQISQALSALDVSRDGVGWAILARSEMTYLQVSGDKTSGFDMEYQKGDLENHYRAARENFTLEEVVEAFARYRDGSIDWPVCGEWDQTT